MEKTQTFKIVIAYARPAAAIHAKETAERLAVELEFECDAWSFELLGVGRVREHAAMVASEADMIIIAACGREELPDSVKDWIESWLPQRRARPAVLAALFDDEWESVIQPCKSHPRLQHIAQRAASLGLGAPGCSSAYLQRVAQRGGMDFICNVGDWRLQDIAAETRPVPDIAPFMPEVQTPGYLTVAG